MASNSAHLWASPLLLQRYLSKWTVPDVVLVCIKLWYVTSATHSSLCTGKKTTMRWNRGQKDTVNVIPAVYGGFLLICMHWGGALFYVCGFTWWTWLWEVLSHPSCHNQLLGWRPQMSEDTKEPKTNYSLLGQFSHCYFNEIQTLKAQRLTWTMWKYMLLPGFVAWIHLQV